jgi:hypothetical protein
MRFPSSGLLFALAASLVAQSVAAAPPDPAPPPPSALPSGSAPATPPATVSAPIGAPISAGARPKIDPAVAAAARLAELIKRGTELCTGGDVDEGLPALRAAWAQHEDADLAVTLASCEIKGSEWPSAAEHLAFALRNKDDPAQRKALEATFLNVRARVGSVKVTITVDGADVFVEDRLAGQSPLPAEVFVAPGQPRIFAKKPGYGEKEGTVTVKAGGTATLTIDLAGEGVVAQSHRTTGTRNPTPGYVLAGFGVVGIGIGAALWAAAVSKGSAADDLLGALRADYPTRGNVVCQPYSSTCALLASLRSSHDALGAGGTGALAAGGALLGAGLIYGLWAAFSTPSEHVTVGLAPAASPTGGGLFAHGTF